MTTATIPRLTEVPTHLQPVPDSLADLDQDLLYQAAHTLGYHGAERVRTVERAISTQRVTERTVIETLLTAGVPVLDTRAVDRYQDRVRRRKKVLPYACLAALMASMPWTLIAVINDTGTTAPEAATIRAMVTMAILGLATIVAWAWLRPKAWFWDDIRLSDYQRPIPSHVLAIALQAAAVLKLTRSDYSPSPSDGFYVSELRQRERQRIDPDPFLSVVVRGVRVYVAAWDEPTFKSPEIRG